MTRDTINYSHGDTGSQPPDGNEFASGERPDAQYFDWYINRFVVSINNVWDEFTRLDSNDDGVVDDSDQYDGTAPSDGTAGQVLTTDGSTTSWADNFEGHNYTDGGGATMVKVGENRFGAEGSTTSATSFTTIAASDLVFNPDDYKDSNGDVYIRVIYHLKHSVNSGDVSARLYRQDAASPVDGSNTDVGDTTVTKTLNDGWGFGDTGWVQLSGDSGFESYQLQLRSSDGETVSYNSVAIWFGQPA